MNKNILLIIADSARADIFEQLLNSGDLPNIEQHIVARGCYRRILSVFPTTTGPAHIPFLTGCHPGSANVPGYRWFDRDALNAGKKKERYLRSYNSLSGMRMHRDFKKSTKTLYDYFKKPAMVLEPVNLCSNSKLKQFRAGKIWHLLKAHYSKKWEPVDHYVQKKIKQLIKKDHDFVTAVFFTIDEHAHLYGYKAQQTLKSYRTIDRYIGEICETLKAKGTYHDTEIILSSDHGHTDTHTHISLIELAKKVGLDPLYYPKIYNKKSDCAIMESGNAMAHIYIKTDDYWQAKPTLSTLLKKSSTKHLIELLHCEKGISFIATRIENGINISNKEGSIQATQKNSSTLLIKQTGKNPLGGNLTDGEEKQQHLLKKTFQDPYPDAINQLLLLFKSPRSGDIIVNAKKGYDLRDKHEHPEHKASHGSLWHEHMHIPLASSINIKEELFSSVDIFPTLLAKSNVTLPVEIDGKPLI